jgi:hypothetical protein
MHFILLSECVLAALTMAVQATGIAACAAGRDELFSRSNQEKR